LRAVAFYIDEDRIVGAVMYNVFGDGLWLARKMINDKAANKNVKDLARLILH
jgi:hypothetical protein